MECAVEEFIAIRVIRCPSLVVPPSESPCLSHTDLFVEIRIRLKIISQVPLYWDCKTDRLMMAFLDQAKGTGPGCCR